jgi:general secretion pathway protein F
MVAVISVMVLLIFVVPQFTQMFEESGKALPLPTQIVITLGEFVKTYWWAMGIGVIALFVLMRRQLADPDSRYAWDERFLSMPLVGDLVAKLEVARFSRTLGTLLDNGVSLLAALSIVKDTLSNSFMAEKLDDVAAKLREGKGMGQPLMEAEVFPKLAVHMVMVGEETGRLSEMLIQVADVFDREVRTAGETHAWLDGTGPDPWTRPGHRGHHHVHSGGDTERQRTGLVIASANLKLWRSTQ